MQAAGDGALPCKSQAAREVVPAADLITAPKCLFTNIAMSPKEPNATFSSFSEIQGLERRALLPFNHGTSLRQAFGMISVNYSSRI